VKLRVLALQRDHSISFEQLYVLPDSLSSTPDPLHRPGKLSPNLGSQVLHECLHSRIILLANDKARALGGSFFGEKGLADEVDRHGMA